MILGLDTSLTSTGVVALDASTCTPVFANTIHGMSNDPIERSVQQATLLGFAINNLAGKPKFAVIENYAFGNTFTLVPLVTVGTLIRLKLRQMGIPFVEVSPKSLKKFVAGSGNAKKDQMRLATFKWWGIEYESHDLVDAYGLARLGLAAAGLDSLYSQYKKPQHEVAQDLRVQLKGYNLLT